jgi:acetyl esterase/lipase
MRVSRDWFIALLIAGIGTAAGCARRAPVATGGGAGNGGASGGGSGGSGGSGGGAGSGGGGGGAGGGMSDAGSALADAGPTIAAGCAGQSWLPLPADPSARGPWPVGARTVTISGLTVEVWYPAAPGSDAGQPTVAYDLREHLPPADATKIPDSDNPLQPCDCVRDLPLDTQHGPYPYVVFVHGTAAFRTQSLTFMTHWASRGFVVVAADHPGIQLKDVLASPLGLPGASDQAGDAGKELDALAQPSGDLAFLAGHLDGTRVAASGHSAGGGAIAGLGTRAEVLIPMASAGTQANAKLVSSLVMGAGNDGIDSYSNVQNGYGSSPAKKRLVGLGGNAGHLAFSDLCTIGADKGGILKIAQDHGVMVPALIATLSQDGCKMGQLPPADGWHIVDYASSAVLEETLLCVTGDAALLSAIQTTLPDVQEYREQL